MVTIKKTYLTTLLREIKQSFGRFFAIFGIVALGTGFLAGLWATTPDMHASVDAYYDKNKMADIFIKATMGLTEDDVQALSTMDEIERIMPAYVTDVLMETDLSELLTARVYGLPFGWLESEDGGFVNRLELVEGSWPKASGECVVELGGGYRAELNIGDTLAISPDNEDYENIGDIYSVTKYTVVGIVTNPFYFSWEREPSSIGRGRLDTVVYVDESSYSLDVYTDFYITLDGSLNSIAFTEEYESSVEEIVAKIEALGETRSKVRYADVVREAQEELDDAKAEYADAKRDAETELADAWQEILDGKAELADAWQEILDGKQELVDARTTLAQEKADGLTEIEKGRKELQDALVELQDGERDIEEAQQKLNDGQREYDEGYQEYKRGRSKLRSAQAAFDEGERQYLAGVAQLEAAEEQISQEEQKLAAADAQLDAAEAEYNAGRAAFELERTQFDALIGQIVTGLASAGLSYDSSDDLLQAIESDTSGTVGAAVDAALASAGVPLDSQGLLETSRALDEAEVELEAAASQISAGRSAYETGIAQVQEAKAQLDANKAELDAAGAEIEANRSKLEVGWGELEDGAAELADARVKLEDGYAELADGRKELDDGWAEYREGLVELADAEATLESEVAKAEQEIQDAEADLAEGEAEYEDGLQDLLEGEEEYQTAKADAEKELNDAWVEISDAEKEIADLKFPEWYVLDRNSNVSYANFSVNADKVDSISKVFPAFFFLVAALVALTTMTRMVEEERTQIGTLKALGYSREAIMSKYVLYAGLASVLGSVVGLLIGFSLLPRVIWNIFRSVYRLSNLIAQFRWDLALVSAGLATLCTMGATVSVCLGTLKEKPASLMLPRAPKAGKRVFLEHIPLVWSRLKFSYKATARNLLRYKKHFFMTVFGVAGCTALMVAGFGLRDSIEAIARTQFDEITRYDLSIRLDDGTEIDPRLQGFLADTTRFDKCVKIFTEAGHVTRDGEPLEATIFVPQVPGELTEVVNLRDRRSGHPILFNDSSVVLTEKLANTLGLRPGDTFSVENADRKTGEFVLSAVTEYYAGSCAYINRADYARAFGDDPQFNALLVKTFMTDDVAAQDAALAEIMESDSVASADSVLQARESFGNLLISIDWVVVVLIVAAGALAVIVLYNLVNINIEERKKELATLKVLGFHDEEVASYIFREISILSVIGTLVGLGLGLLLHAFVITKAETPDFMFGRSVSIWSLVFSAVATLLFSLVVELIMSRNLKKIRMVDSMKVID